MGKVIIITKKDEWLKYWCNDKKKHTLFISPECHTTEKYSKGVELIAVKGENQNKFMETMKSIEKVELWDQEILKQNSYVVCHDESPWEKVIPQNWVDVKSKTKYYSISGGGNRLQIWKKLIYPLTDAIKDEKSNNCEDIHKWLIKLCMEDVAISEIPWPWSTSIHVVLGIFLPLDIDMQALQATTDVEGYLRDMYAGLEEPYKLDKYNGRNKNEHYRQKLYDLWFLLERSEKNKERASSEARRLTPINNPHDDLLKLAGLGNGNRKESPIYRFLESLDERRKNGNDLKEEVKYLFAPFESSGLKIGENEEVKSFHDWYCELSRCLRGERA
jgi:hypothetical protein